MKTKLVTQAFVIFLFTGSALTLQTIVKGQTEQENVEDYKIVSYEVPESGVRYHTPEEVKNSHPIEEFSEFDEDMQEVF
ncbi:hypothetical protein C7B80_32295, partial [Cyanosarcina cf. burmensis CCALA 770]